MLKLSTHQQHFYLSGSLFGFGYLYYFIISLMNGTADSEIMQSKMGMMIFGGLCYYLGCVTYFHMFLKKISNGNYPVQPWKIFIVHFIPFYNLYYTYKWPKEIFYYFNFSIDHHMKITKYGMFLIGSLICLNIEPGIAMVSLFLFFFLLVNKVINEYNSGNMNINTEQEAKAFKKLL